MPQPLTIRLQRRPDGAVVFELRRADATSTWMRRTGPTAEFFAVHDLTHYAVETTLGLTQGFYGLVAQGWDLDDFGSGWPRGPLPMESLAIEVIVGCFDRAARGPLTARECGDAAESYFATRGERPPIQVTDAQVDAIRACVSTLVARWRATAADAPLILEFPARSPGAQ